MRLTSRTRNLLIAVTSSAALGAAMIAPSGALAVETCMGYTANIVGTAGNDVVYGNPASVDVVSLLGGNDAYIEDSSNDIVCLGAGDDQLTSSIGSVSGNDTVQGGPGNDVIAGFAGSDTLIGGDGDDQVFGNDGNDTLNGEAGNDYLVGGLGSDSVNGNGGLYDQLLRRVRLHGLRGHRAPADAHDAIEGRVHAGPQGARARREAQQLTTRWNPLWDSPPEDPSSARRPTSRPRTCTWRTPGQASRSRSRCSSMA